MKVKYIAIFLLVIGIGALIVYRITENKSNDGKAKDKGGNKAQMRVNGVVVSASNFANNILLSGSIEANEQIEIRSEISGVVEGIYFEEGSSVTKGQVLFKVNDLELRAQVAQAQTKQDLAAENERRAKLLLQKEAISQEEYDVARADLKSAQAQSQLIRAQIAKTSIRAPFSGRIGLRNISPGSYVTPATLVAKLVSQNPLKITFSIPEKYANQMKVNTDVSFSVAGSTERYKAKIYAIEPEIEIATRTLKLRAIAQNPDGKLIPGTFANVDLPLSNTTDALVIPSEAVIPIQNGKKVFITEKGKAKEVIVETSTRTDKNIVVTTGLKVGDTVLTTGVMGLKNGTGVKVTLVNTKN
ncbi:efflux RND transporter periplasmic adaptor subunit [Flavobacterium sp. '19STA2R22 D10 B1']|uniref:efflux RND transporter periplasmic adaptor subunit n=1 Tax=Flavobacterium aerium TaxID=3037261 RepID=UPI00278C7786|nr:efflux RND transporter periplasmic adaptor subunit [Flavobacterium sp. '19STA2R22 D10 B1']